MSTSDVPKIRVRYGPDGIEYFRISAPTLGGVRLHVFGTSPGESRAKLRTAIRRLRWRRHSPCEIIARKNHFDRLRGFPLHDQINLLHRHPHFRSTP